MSTSETPIPTLGRIAPIISNGFDHSASAHRITSVILTEKNFAAWSRSLRLYLDGKGKSGWLLETEKPPPDNDPKRAQWDIDNCTILGWMFNSMEERIYNMFMF